MTTTLQPFDIGESNLPNPENHSRDRTLLINHQEGRTMTVVTSHRTSTPQSSTGLSRRSALRGLGGVTVAALLAAGPQADRVMAQAATPSAMEPRFSEWAAGWAAVWTSDPAGVADVYAANVVGDDFATGEHFDGADAIRSHIESFHANFSDLEITVTSGFLCEDRAALEFLVSGTYSGQPEGNGTPVSNRVAALFELEDGKIVREAHYWDVYAFLIEIGALPAPGAATPTP